MTYPNLEMKTKEELEAVYNSTERRFSNGTQGEFARRGVKVLKAPDYYIGKQGEVRWVMSDNIVPSDILEMAVVDGTISIETRNKTEEVRIVNDAKLWAKYRSFRQQYGYSEEEKAEMRAAFGEDEEVIDIITGQQVILN